MIQEPATKRCVVFFDGQNLFHAAQEAFGYSFPNFDADKLAKAVCLPRGWTVSQIRFYTGVHEAVKNAFWHTYWTNKLAVMGAHGIITIRRPLRYRNRTDVQSDGKAITFSTAEEKGIDVRIAVDVIRMAHRNEYDVGLIFSQDQDLAEVADEIRVIAREQNRWINLASAYPRRSQPTMKGKNWGINKTDWIEIDKAIYDASLDMKDYRPKTGKGNP